MENLELLSSLTDFIANVGFPKFVSMYLLNKMDHIIAALNQLTKAVADEK